MYKSRSGITSIALVLCSLFFALPATGQVSGPRNQSVQDAQMEFQRMLSQKGAKSAFLEFLSDDAVIFQPDAVNGKQYWSAVKAEPDGRLNREMLYVDMASSGLVGYSTGKWEWTPKGKERPTERGQFVTVWAKRQGGRFQAVLDITTSEDAEAEATDNDRIPREVNGDPNKRGWSAADPSMNFLKTAMGGGKLGGAYSAFAADEIRLIREGEPPIQGRKRVISETEDYRSITYPKRVVLNESADMAYVWNPCEYANSDEGVERGNCLHIWKLRGKRWYVTLGVLSRVRNMKKPQLKLRPKQAVRN
jgi:ketosteroid isomerase-like protein